MSEEEWLACDNAEWMNDFYRERHTERKARLLMLACCKRFPEHLTPEAVKVMVDMLTAHYADPKQPDEPFDGMEIRSAYEVLEQFASPTQGAVRGLAFGIVAAAEPVSCMKNLDDDFVYLVFSCVHDVAAWVTGGKAKREARFQAALVREVLGNPFRPVAIEPAWLTETVVSRTREMYEHDDFSAMPTLADALQDAGCENADILDHCRDEKQVHVRGCWVVDMILGKA